MAFRVHGLSVESRSVTVFAQGTVGDTETQTNPANCGESADPPCCGPTYTSSLLIAAEGPLEFFFSPVVLDWTLEWDGERQSWAGSVTDGSVEIGAELWCEEDPELGQVWWLSGSYVNADGDSVPYFVTGTDTGDFLAFEVEISGTTELLTLVVDHPCSGSSGSDSGGMVSFCTCTEMPLVLYAEFDGALSSYGVQTLVWNPSTESYLFTWGGTACNPVTSALSLTCVDTGPDVRLSAPAGLNTSFSVTATPSGCSPFLADFSGTADGPCSGAFTAQVRETP